MGSNLVLTGGKAVAGYASNSQVLIADAVHSFSDLLSDVLTMVIFIDHSIRD